MAYAVHFDDKSVTRTGISDYVSLFQDSARLTYWGSPLYAGALGSGAWNSTSVIIVYASSFIVNFVSATTSSGTIGWGYSLWVTPLTSMPTQPQYQLDSPHNYWSGLTFSTKVSVRGAVGYAVHFDSRGNTRSGISDFVNLYTDASKKNYWGSPFFAGSLNSGAWDPNNIIYISNASFVLNFVASTTSSGSIGWGFKLWVTPIYDAVPFQPEFHVDSPHNYWTGMNYASTIAVPGAVAYAVHFDNKGATRSGITDYVNLYQDSTYSTYWGCPYFAGYLNSGAWNESNVYIVYDSSFIVHFTSSTTSSGTIGWGYSLWVTPLRNISEAPVLTTMQYNSPHNYWTNINVYNDIFYPGATGYNVTFDASSVLSSGDYVTFYQNAMQLSYYGQSQYTGTSLGSLSTLMIPAQSFGMKFYTDGSGSSVGYGYKVNVVPTFNEVVVPPANTVPAPANATPVWGVNYLATPGHSLSFGAAQLTRRLSFSEAAFPAFDSVTMSSVGTLQNSAYDNGGAVTLTYSSGTTSYPYVELSSPLFAADSSVTIEVWVTLGTNTGNADIFQFGADPSSGSAANSIALYRSSSGFITASVYDAQGNAFTVQTTTTFNAQSNAHIAVVFSQGAVSATGAKNGVESLASSSSNQMSVYVNGVLRGSGTSTSVSLPDGTNGGFLGKSFSPGSTGLIGVIDELRVWSGPLTGDNVATSYSSGADELAATPCALNFYNPRTGETACVACPANSGTNTTGTVDTCRCNGGYSTNGTGDSLVCSICSGGSYAPYGSYSCATCNAGTAAQAGSEVCSSCSSGHFATVGSASCSVCAENEYSGEASGSCSACPQGATSAAGSATCSCSAGYEQSGSGYSLDCSICPVKTYSAESGSTSCTSCPPGTSSSEAGATGCDTCKQGTYSKDMGSEIVCKACPAGRTTPTAGSSQKSECLNPSINFAMGYFLAGLAILFGLVYLIGGRIVDIAAHRRDNTTLRFAAPSTMIMLMIDDMKEKFNVAHYCWAIVYLVFGSVLVFLCTSLFHFVASLSRLFFSAMIIARSIKRFLYFNVPIVAVMDQWAESLNIQFSINISAIVSAIKFLYNFEFDLSAVQLTCSGAQAPVELAFNLVILCAIVVWIRADYQLLLTQVISPTFGKYAAWSVLRRDFTWATVFSACMWAFLQFNPLVSIMQYLMSLITITRFVEFEGRHPSTPACNTIVGMPNIDIVLALISTITVYCITLPMVYTLSHIIFEGTPSYFRLTESQIQHLENADSFFAWRWKVSKVTVQSWTWLEKLFSLDVLFLRWVHHCTQKQAEHVEAKHESHRSISGSTKQFSVDRNANYPDFFRNSAVGSVSDLPSYGQMMLLVKHECENSFFLTRWFKAYTFVGQLTSTVGRDCWWTVAWKYYGFVLVCFGFWSEEGFKSMQFPDRLTQVVLGDDHSIEAKKLLSKSFLSSVSSIVGPRAILFQAIPTPVFTVFSVFTLQTCNSPMYLCNTFADNIPEYMQLRGVGEAANEELSFFRRIISFVYSLTMKRVFKLPYNLFTFLTVAGIATLPLSFWKQHWRIEVVTGILAFHACLRGVRAALRFTEKLWSDHQQFNVQQKIFEMGNLGSTVTGMANATNSAADQSATPVNNPIVNDDSPL